MDTYIEIIKDKMEENERTPTEIDSKVQKLKNYFINCYIEAADKKAEAEYTLENIRSSYNSFNMNNIHEQKKTIEQAEDTLKSIKEEFKLMFDEDIEDVKITSD